MRAQEAAPSPPQRSPVEYRLVPWRPADTEWCLREATGDQVASVPDMLAALASELSPRNHPRLQAAVAARVAAAMQEAGREGWRFVWLREGSAVVEGYALPAPALYFER
ncbi:MAG: hypothetical protein D6731_10335 [Planctomycetota bacterium]|nr:MAG: hypothetical protein D6731_10335 [Planctomycetota bacterium]